MFRIRGELPQFKRCCMCLPLRHGLIVWGYIRLVIGILLLIGVTKGFFELLALSKKETGYEKYVVLLGFFVILAGVDIVLNVVFIYAGHTKHLKMLRVYYIYSFVLWILMIIMGLCLILYAVHVMQSHGMDFLHVLIVLCDVVTFLAEILIQAYILLLVRSQFKKLTNNCEFQFENKATESACRMKSEEEALAYIDDIDNTDNIADVDIRTDKKYTFNQHKGIYRNGISESKDTY
ncbi:hypothetical protein PYW07_012081 [Mythimna separata]|uniref:Uncharacterized protein n=1 Tax=Mythimna separata TaxID=271217 RepID=A0AAD7YLG5_MYTSE|nr:hypothetical protein PYW07_012081 [Mythimna separata]